MLKATLRSEQVLLRCFRAHPSLTRLEIQEITGLSRVTVSQGVARLLAEKVLVENESVAPSGGRKAATLELNSAGGYVGVISFTATAMSIALTNLQGHLIKPSHSTIDIGKGPSKILPDAVQRLSTLFEGVPKSKRLGVVVGVPGPVSHELGRVVSPPIMKGWDGIDFHKEVGDKLGVPSFLENDANLMAFAEHRLIYPEVKDLILIKIATGIGSGLIFNRRLHRGAEGSAGDIGHVQLDALKGSTCRCGHTDCVESFSGGWALVEKINAMGYAIKDSSDIAELCRKGDTKILRLIAEASGYIGHAIADAVNLLNPSKIVIEGRIAKASDIVLATIKEVVYQRSGALATKNLEIVPSKLGDERAVLGAAHLGLDRFFYSIEEN